LGSGGFGVVFRATYKGRDVAVKEPHDSDCFQRDERLRAAFMREANNLHKMYHRNVVEFVGAVTVDHHGDASYMMVTELLPESLEGFLVGMQTLGAEERRERALCIAMELAEGLAFLHSVRIVHRDIKPQNIMMDRRGSPKYIDFGLSKEKDSILPSRSSTRLAGTIDWMSPEKKRGGASTSASDVYSLGLVFMNIVTGEKP
ncbi:hypothetical protein GUITHDRAFT_62407, partial [Guillardia theta CCMP2712]